jgi:hypothetical protein
MTKDTDAILGIVRRIDSNVKLLLQKEKLEMATLADVQTEVTAMATTVQAAIAALKDLASKSADPTAVNAIATQLQAAHDSLQAAVDAAEPPAV